MALADVAGAADVGVRGGLCMSEGFGAGCWGFCAGAVAIVRVTEKVPVVSNSPISAWWSACACGSSGEADIWQGGGRGRTSGVDCEAAACTALALPF